MFVQRDSQLGGAGGDVFAVHAAGKGLVLHFLFYPGDIHIKNRFCGFDQGAGSQKPGELIAGKECPGQMGLARDSGILCMPEDGGADLLRPALLDKEAIADEGMLLARRMALVIEIV